MTHFLSKAHHLPCECDRLASAAELFWQVYLEGISQLNWANELEPRVVRHTLGCLLARVAGKTPLEYLTPAERTRQPGTVLALIPQAPTSAFHLIHKVICRPETQRQKSAT